MELSLLILVCIHKSYIVYLEIYVVPIGHGFSFFGHRKVMENQLKKGSLICADSAIKHQPTNLIFHGVIVRSSHCSEIRCCRPTNLNFIPASYLSGSAMLHLPCYRYFFPVRYLAEDQKLFKHNHADASLLY